jgi:hypothetical protein
VILDACHSGIALDPVIKWRDSASWRNESLAVLKTRRSRRIITSALDDQVALDSGPMHGHSLFTGCLLEGLQYGLRERGSTLITGSEIGLYVQRRVQTYPHSRQTPDFGTFAFDDRGEMVISLAAEADHATAAIIGRTEDNDIAINHHSISRNHAKLTREPETGRYTISDLQSSNGVRVNGSDYGKVELRRGDVVDLGHVRLRFVEAGEDFVFARDAVISDVPGTDEYRREIIRRLAAAAFVVVIIAAVTLYVLHHASLQS